MLDRISWRNPEDYWFFKYQQKSKPINEKKFKFPKFGWLKNNKKEQPAKTITPEQVTEKIESQINARDEAKIQIDAYLNQRKEAAEHGIFT